MSEGFLGIPSLAGPTYGNEFSWDWMSQDAFMSGHDDLALPVKVAYFILPLLAAIRIERYKVVDWKEDDVDKGEYNTNFDFNALDYFITMSFPAGVQLYWLTTRLIEAGLVIYDGQFVQK